MILSFTTAVLDNILIYHKLDYFIASLLVGLSENDDILTLRSEADKKNALLEVDTFFQQILYLSPKDAFEKCRNMLQYITYSRIPPNLVLTAYPFPLLHSLFPKGFHT